MVEEEEVGSVLKAACWEGRGALERLEGGGGGGEEDLRRWAWWLECLRS